VEIFAGLDAYPADDALVRVIVEAGWGGIEREFLLRLPQTPYSPTVDTEFGHQGLELALAIAGAAMAGEVMIGDE